MRDNEEAEDVLLRLLSQYLRSAERAEETVKERREELKKAEAHLLGIQTRVGSLVATLKNMFEIDDPVDRARAAGRGGASA